MAESEKKHLHHESLSNVGFGQVLADTLGRLVDMCSDDSKEARRAIFVGVAGLSTGGEWLAK